MEVLQRKFTTFASLALRFCYYLTGLGHGHLRLGWGPDHDDDLIRRVHGAAQVLTPHIPQRGKVLKMKTRTKSSSFNHLGMRDN